MDEKKKPDKGSVSEEKKPGKGGESCGYKGGELPSCASLALAYVPMQQSGEPAYESDIALIRGTLFPGLDLPFMNVVNSKTLDTPTAELSALDFVCHELGLYLDTHKNDKEAFAAFQSFLKLAEEGRKRYVSLYGPISSADMLGAGSFTWLNNPWPWEYDEGGKK